MSIKLSCGCSENIQNGKQWFMTLGIILLLVGSCAVVFPVFFTLAIETFVGLIIFCSGILQVIHALWSRKFKGFIVRLLGGIVPLVIGLVLLVYPAKIMSILTLVLAVFFVLEGIIRIFLSLQLRPLSCWGWALFSGFVSLLLGTMIFSQWPGDALWIIGLFIGIDILFAGWAFVMLSLSLRK